MAKPMGIPSAPQRKKLASMTTAASVMSRSGGSNVGLPGPAEQPPEASGRADDHSDHEDGEAGIDDVHADMQDQRVVAPGEQHIADGGGQADGEDRQHAGRGENGETTLPARAARGVEHVEGDVLARVEDRGAGEKDNPDVRDGTDLE